MPCCSCGTQETRTATGAGRSLPATWALPRQYTPSGTSSFASPFDAASPVLIPVQETPAVMPQSKPPYLLIAVLGALVYYLRYVR